MTLSGRTALDWAVLEGWQEVAAALRGEAPVWNLAVEPAHTSELDGWLGRVLDADGTALDGTWSDSGSSRYAPHQPAASQLERPIGPMLETGIKALDLLAPLSRGGAAWLSARGGVGLMVLLAELSRRLAHRGGRVVFVRWQERFYRVEDALRELRELGTDDITTMVLGRLADPTERREQALLTGWSIAEAFRAEGRDVLLIVDVPPAGLPELEALRTLAPCRRWTRFDHVARLRSGAAEHRASNRRVVQRAIGTRTSPSISSLRGAACSQRWIRWPVRADCCATVSSIRSMRALRGRCARSWSGVEQTMAMDRPALRRCRRVRGGWSCFRRSRSLLPSRGPRRPGESVPFEDTLADYSALLDGAADTLPEEALRYVGRWRPISPSEAPG